MVKCRKKSIKTAGNFNEISSICIKFSNNFENLGDLDFVRLSFNSKSNSFKFFGRIADFRFFLFFSDKFIVTENKIFIFTFVFLKTSFSFCDRMKEPSLVR